MNAPVIHYSIRPLNPQAHLFEVCCTVTKANPAGQRFALPAWIPGSYLIRDFARHVVLIRAEVAGAPVPLHKVDKHTWQVAPLPAQCSLTVIAEIYAWDLSVRSAYLDHTHAFFNGSSVFLRVLGREEERCLVDILRPDGELYTNWQVATAMTPADRNAPIGSHDGFGLYEATDYEELIDHPVEMGTFVRAAFSAGGVEHHVILTGRHDCDLPRLCQDLQRICAWQIAFFGDPAPFQQYVFLITAVGDGYGGLEHRASSAILCARDDLPHVGMKGVPERYRGFLGLCSHEYFHAWNVKRIRPAAFARYDLDRENYTSLLWVFEGFTSYYDDLTLLRCGLIKPRDWLQQLARTIDRVQRDPGRLRQTLAESSFDAWIKAYRPDENTPNAVVSYYAKGALVALALDLTLRAATESRCTLDDVMRTLWLRHGQSRENHCAGVGEEDIRLIAEGLSDLDLQHFFADSVFGTSELPLARLFKPFAIHLKATVTNKSPTLGVRTALEANEVRLATVFENGAAQSAGLSAGDVLVAVDRLRITPSSLERLLSRRRAGDKIIVHTFRRDELMAFTVELAEPAPDRHRLTRKKKPNALRRHLFRGR